MGPKKKMTGSSHIRPNPYGSEGASKRNIKERIKGVAVKTSVKIQNGHPRGASGRIQILRAITISAAETKDIAARKVIG
jgi:hypothetical protein